MLKEWNLWEWTKIFCKNGVVQKIMNDGQTKWIVQRNEKLLFFKNGWSKTKTNDLKSFDQTWKSKELERTHFTKIWTNESLITEQSILLYEPFY